MSPRNILYSALIVACFSPKVKASNNDELKAIGFKVEKGFLLVQFDCKTDVNLLHTVAGILGVKKFQYEIWGDTVNTASRMESAGEVGKVNISQATYDLLKDDPDFTFESRGKIEVKGKGEMEMLFVSLKK